MMWIVWRSMLPLLMLGFAVSAKAESTPYGRVIVESGVTAYQVLQRDSDGKANFTMTGRALSEGNAQLEYRILRRTQTVAGFDWQTISVSTERKWTVDVKGLPTGGPFAIEFRLRDASGNELDSRTVENVLVGDLWVTAGQSNMDGRGEMSAAETPSERVHVLTLADEWQVAEDPTHYCNESIYPVYLTSYVTRIKRNPIKYQPRGEWPTWKAYGVDEGTSVGMSFGINVERETDVPIGLIICSLGGTTLDQWSPSLKDKGGESMYGAMLLRINKFGGKVRGVLWYQGESDSSDGASATYAEKLAGLVKAIRADLSDENVVFYTVQIGRQVIGRVDVSSAEKNVVREAQRQVMSITPNCGLVTAVDLGLLSGAHLDGNGYKRVGQRLAKLALSQIYGDDRYQVGPTLKGVSFDDKDRKTLRIEFQNYNGRLIASSRVLGFRIRNEQGVEIPYVEANLDKDSPGTVIINIGQSIPEKATLWYGDGWDPICTLADEADMALAAFGPVPLGK